MTSTALITSPFDLEIVSSSPTIGFEQTTLDQDDSLIVPLGKEPHSSSPILIIASCTL